MSAEQQSQSTPRRLGKYELIERIGVGGMAEVHLARMSGPMGFQKVVVVKTIHPNLSSQRDFVEMLLDEARVSALIKHPRVVDIYDLGCVDGQYFIAMEHLEGQPLLQIMRAGTRQRPLDVYSTARIIADAAEGLHAAHELKSLSGRPLDLVHRDVSPGNIIVLDDGGVKLVDFGVAKARGRLSESGVQQLKGKLGYMAPEQISGRAVDRRSDIFSLGVVLWEALALKRLFPAHEVTADEAARRIALLGICPPSTHRREVPPALDAISMRALAPAPEARFQTAEAMKLAIESVLRQADYRRDAGLVAAYCKATFSKRRRRRSMMLRRLGTAADHADAETGEGSEPHGEASTAASTVGSARSRRGGRLAVLAVLLLGAAGAAAYVGGELPWLDDPEPRAAARQSPRQTAARAAPATPDPAPDPTPDVRPPEPAAIADAGPRASEAPADAGEGDRRDPPAADMSSEDEEVDKKDARALYQKGTALFVKGKLGAAKRAFKETLRANPRHAGAHRGLGLIYQASGRKRAAIRHFKRYLRLRGNAADAAKIRSRLAALEK